MFTCVVARQLHTAAKHHTKDKFAFIYVQCLNGYIQYVLRGFMYVYIVYLLMHYLFLFDCEEFVLKIITCTPGCIQHSNPNQYSFKHELRGQAVHIHDSVYVYPQIPQKMDCLIIYFFNFSSWTLKVR